MACCTVACLVVFTRTAVAEEEAGGNEDGLFVGGYVSVMGGMIDREWSLGGDAFFDLFVKGFRLTVGAPLRFDGGGLRSEHWDEAADFGRIVREISYTRPKDRLAIRIGPVSAINLGIGNLVSMYNSTVDPDHWRTGFTGSYHAPPGGIDLFMDSLIWPEVVGGRVYVRPFEAIHPGGFAGRLEIGGTLVVDFKVPENFTRLRRTIVFGDANLPDVSTKRLIGAGLDIRWPVYRSEVAEVVPYFAMSAVGEGSGLHVGLALDAHPVEDIGFGLAGEWRYLGSGYIAPYFDSLYMVDRFDYDTADPSNARTKAKALEHTVNTRMGAMAALYVEWADMFVLWVQFDWDQEGDNSQLRAGIDVDVLGLVGIRLSLLERGIPTFKKVFDPDRLVFATAVDVNVWKNIAVFGSYSRDVAIKRSGDDRGLYRPTDSFMLGVRVGFAYEK